ncbi:hypothetical protein [Brenneria corticis]|uniref:Uncharacterized protein n=1 Tax=Brenneria corticis TaxID=2173106 RepID=A0A2U1TU72_9GAMM|nr:hypothetical protein [Brenneria sp. CFCC 11842]PWC12957.1 hypothetical protein DDT56_16120 [Brenneria sp. CFCC 11842]
MTVFSIRSLLGISSGRSAKRRAVDTQSTDPRDNMKKISFSHLTSKARGQEDQQAQQAQQDKHDDDLPKVAKPSQHSRFHNVAVSEEAKNSPVLAVRLLRATKLKSSEIKARLREEPEALSAFTMKFMEENNPGWEFLDDSEKAFSAEQFALTRNDKNGYLTSRDRALKVLKSMEEPMTDDERDALIARTQQMMNASDPNTPDNVAARQKAADEYHEQMAKAIVHRNNQIRATGMALPGDRKRADGKPVGPDDEVQRVAAMLKAGNPVDGFYAGGVQA